MIGQKNKFPKWVWVNGRWFLGDRPALSPFDRGFLYGDGIYETMRVYDGAMFQWSAHMRRLQKSAREIGMKVPLTSQQIERAVHQLVQRNKLHDATIRLTLSRGCGPRGLNPNNCQLPTMVLMAFPLSVPSESQYKKGVRVSLVKTRRNPIESLSPMIKSTNSLNNIQGVRESVKQKSFEALFLNTRGFLAEGSVSNVFFIKKNKLHTPHLSCGLLAGITRNIILRIARQMGMKIDEGRYRPTSLYSAESVFLSNTSIEALSVVQIVDPAGMSHPIGTGQPDVRVLSLREVYREIVEKELKIRRRS